ncbi:efflux RND transporter periplasmic adaptor subunit [Candidatus Uabimicrobium amorphum]|uniref:Hemolysin D n=1 Tax=Uabimicrobium amorphum TaxID=2596890 RepID=A0A5S9IME1_UABAM|nr:HlyD family secretion protein [Candidatus Uabimicrobium amorphum]BBM83720.1 hemolysin D [Candidatus Uabimicrobium amorphum]
MLRHVVYLSLCLVFYCGCEEAKVESKINEFPTTPVKVITLNSKNPSFDLRLTGTVDTWKQEEISFEVGGKIDYVIDSGADVEGPLKNIQGKIVKQGTILAKIDQKIYRLRVESAKADIKALQAEYKTTETEINHVIPAQIAEAKSSLQLAERNYKRLSRLMVTDSTSQSELDQARSSLDSAKAKMQQIQAQKKVKEVSLLNVRAQMKKLNESLKSAKLDVENCVVRAPFDGRVSQVHVIRGGYVQPGKAVLTLVLMDPIQISVAVSPKTDRQLNVGDFATIYHPNWKQPATGWIYAKDTVADRNTRTFNLQILVRNFKIDRRMEKYPERKKLPRITDLMPIVSRHYYQNNKKYVNVDCLNKDAKGHYVWRTNHYIGTKFDGVTTVTKMYVTVSDDMLDFLGLFTFRSIVVNGNQVLQKAIKDRAFLALNVPKGVKSGDKVVLVRENWLFRPGELVEIDLNLNSSPFGVYVPMKAILQEDAKHYVFKVETKKDGTFVRKVQVRLFQSFADTRRVESDELSEGDQVVVQGAHYLLPGEKVKVGE